MNADQAFDIVSSMAFDTVLDIGSGDGEHSRLFTEDGRIVTSISYIGPADLVGDYMEFDFCQFDCIWASHVLEHQLNTNAFLAKIYNDLKDGGVLAITVPPLKKLIVGGHVSMWNAGLLLYHLILAGFDCSSAMVKTYGYNISVIVRKKPACLDGLVMDFGDIDTLSRHFPMPVVNGFDGNIEAINW